MNKILFWGTNSLLSRIVFSVLLNAGIFPHTKTTLLLHTPHHQTNPLLPPPNITQLPVAPPTIAGIAWHNHIPVWEIGNLNHTDTHRFIAQLQPDLAIVACFPQKFPPDLLAIPRLGFVNLHPSLLPAFRGPVPLFWQFRAGLTEIGVTLHHMDTQFDTGDILAQTSVTLPLGCSGQEADRLCAKAGGELLVREMPAIFAQTHTPLPQTKTSASYYTFPTDSHFTLNPAWTAQHAFHFMRGTAEWQRPYTIQHQNKKITLTHALQITDTPPQILFPQTIAIPFANNQYLIAQTPT
jgi:methionyl-tRNA formyltransferase